MNILITGASGFIGQHIMQACMDHGHCVTACVRNPGRLQRYYPEAHTFACDFATDHDESVWLPRIAGADVVINTAGVFRETRRSTFESVHVKAVCALFKACETASVGKVIQISALGADNSAFSEYHLSKKAADDFLRQLNINWILVQPSIVYGPGAKSTRLFQALAALPCTPLIGSGDQLIQPIYIHDLSKAVLTAIEGKTFYRQCVAAVGPEPVSMETLFNLMKQRLDGTTACFIKMPYRMALFAAQLASFLSSAPINADAVRMLQTGNTASVQPFIASFGFTPLNFQQALFQRSPLPSERLDAKLYFLLPMLKLSLAMLWIATGFISAFGYPLESSYALLEQVMGPHFLMPAVLYGAATLDVALGLALLISYRLRAVLTLQIIIIITYSVIITLVMPEFWRHPFGPITKNIPLLVATWILLRAEE